jgi:MATE family multidrug resistance protein
MASLIFDCVFWLCGFLRMGTVALTAQALGADDATEQRAVLARAMLLAAGLGMALLVMQIPLGIAIFRLMGGSDAVTAAASSYFAIRMWSAPFALGNYVMLGWLVGLAMPKRALAIQIVINVVDIALTAWLVLKLDLGVPGAAFAAVVAEIVGLLLGVAMAWHALGGRFALTLDQVIDRARLLRMLSINRDIFIRTVALVAAFLFFSAMGARTGDVTLAANAVLHNFTLVGAFFLDGMANAAEQLCGRTYGARDRSGFERAVKLVVIWGFVFGIAASLLFALAGRPAIDAMTASTDVRQAAYALLWLAALAPVCGVLAFAFDGVYVGATWARDMRNLMLASFAIYLAVWFVTQPLGNPGLWVAILSFFISRGLLQAARYPALTRQTFAEARA